MAETTFRSGMLIFPSDDPPVIYVYHFTFVALRARSTSSAGAKHDGYFG